MMKAALCLLAAATLAAGQSRDLLDRELQAVSQLTKVGLTYQPELGPGTLDLPATYPRAARTATGLMPDQVSPLSHVIVTWQPHCHMHGTRRDWQLLNARLASR